MAKGDACEVGSSKQASQLDGSQTIHCVSSVIIERCWILRVGVYNGLVSSADTQLDWRAQFGGY